MVSKISKLLLSSFDRHLKILLIYDYISFSLAEAAIVLESVNGANLSLMFFQSCSCKK